MPHPVLATTAVPDIEGEIVWNQRQKITRGGTKKLRRLNAGRGHVAQSSLFASTLEVRAQVGVGSPGCGRLSALSVCPPHPAVESAPGYERNVF